MPRNTSALGVPLVETGRRASLVPTGTQKDNPAQSPSKIGMANTPNLSTPNQTRNK